MSTIEHFIAKFEGLASRRNFHRKARRNIYGEIVRHLRGDNIPDNIMAIGLQNAGLKCQTWYLYFIYERDMDSFVHDDFSSRGGGAPEIKGVLPPPVNHMIALNCNWWTPEEDPHDLDDWFTGSHSDSQLDFITIRHELFDAFRSVIPPSHFNLTRHLIWLIDHENIRPRATLTIPVDDPRVYLTFQDDDSNRYTWLRDERGFARETINHNPRGNTFHVDLAV